MDDPLEEAENRSERHIKGIEKIMRQEQAREQFQADLEFSRLPWWVQAEWEGDYSPWDAGNYPDEEQND